jgi:hypothetical protein
VTDPIFVTIEGRNQLHAAHEAACKALSEYENSHRTPEGWLPVDEVVCALDEKANETCHANHRALIYPKARPFHVRFPPIAD